MSRLSVPAPCSVVLPRLLDERQPAGAGRSRHQNQPVPQSRAWPSTQPIPVSPPSSSRLVLGQSRSLVVSMHLREPGPAAGHLHTARSHSPKPSHALDRFDRYISNAIHFRNPNTQAHITEAVENAGTYKYGASTESTVSAPTDAPMSPAVGIKAFLLANSISRDVMPAASFRN